MPPPLRRGPGRAMPVDRSTPRPGRRAVRRSTASALQAARWGSRRQPREGRGARGMTVRTWGSAEAERLAAIRDDLAQVSTATAYHMMLQLGWRNTYMQGLLPLQPLGLGKRLVGRARTCRYLMRRGPESGPNPEARRKSAEIVTIESLEPGDVFCVDALGVTTAGIIGDILTARIKSRGAVAT